MPRRLLEHMVTAQLPVSQRNNKGIVFQKLLDILLAVSAINKGYLLRRKFFRLPHEQKQLLLRSRKRLQQDRSNHLVNTAAIEHQLLILAVSQKVQVYN